MRILFIATFIMFVGCVTTSHSNDKARVEESMHGTQVRWYDGDVENAIEVAKDKEMPLFLYWGAVWCPPCNQLKAEVFSHPHAAELFSSSIAVYLDGDSEDAQIWADRLQVSNYPTMLIIQPDGQEVMRLSEAMNFQEFAKAFRAALAQKESFIGLLHRVARGQAREQDWRTLAYYSWHDAKDMDIFSDEVLRQRLLLVEKIPAQMKAEKALLAASVLGAAIEIRTKSPTMQPGTLLNIRGKGPELLESIFADYAGIYAARNFVIYQYQGAMDFLYTAQDPQRQVWKDRWLRAAALLARDTSLSLDTRLWAVYPEIVAYKMATRSKAFAPPALQSKVKAAVAHANQEAKSDFLRTSLIPGASVLLREVGFVAEARELLKNEIKNTSTPWYYQAALADLEESLGHKRGALYWSDLARRSAQGRASRIQWTASDLLLGIRLDVKLQRLRYLTYDLYKMALSFEDGFSGRNRYRLDTVAKTIRGSRAFVGLRPDLIKLRTRCSKLSDPARDACNRHFNLYRL